MSSKLAIEEKYILRAEENGISKEILTKRLNYGWDIERVVTEEIVKRNPRTDFKKAILAVFKGDNFITSGTLKEVSDHLGISEATCKTYFRFTKDVKPGSDKLKMYVVDKKIETPEEIGKTIEKYDISPSFTKWDVDIYALYKGEELLADGNVFEIAEQTGKTVETLRHLTKEIVKKRNKGNALSMVYLYTEGEEDE